jgi:hypothetical protein
VRGRAIRVINPRGTLFPVLGNPTPLYGPCDAQAPPRMLTGRRYVSSISEAPSRRWRTPPKPRSMCAVELTCASSFLPFCYLRCFRSGPHTVRPGCCRLHDCCACCNCWPGARCTGLSRVGVLRLTPLLFCSPFHRAIAHTLPSEQQPTRALHPPVLKQRATLHASRVRRTNAPHLVGCLRPGKKTQPPFRKPFSTPRSLHLRVAFFIHMYPQVCWGAHLLRERLHLPRFLCSAAKVLRHRCSHAIRFHLGQ